MRTLMDNVRFARPGRGSASAAAVVLALTLVMPVADILAPTSAAASTTTTSAADSTFRAVAPSRIMNRVSVGARSTYTLKIPGVPAGATAVALNVTATSVQQNTFVSACAAGTPIAACTSTSALNPRPGSDTAGSALVKLGGVAGDEVTFYNNAGSLTLIADLEGFYVAGDPTGSTFVPRAPERAMSYVFSGGQSATLTLANVPSGATAVAVNVTASGSTRMSYVSVCPADQSLASCKTSSTLNASVQRDVSNFAVVKLGGPAGNQLTVYEDSGVGRLIIDVQGYFVLGGGGSSGSALFRATAPSRVLDHQPMGAGSSYTLTLANAPTNATAVAMNVTAAGASQVSFVSTCPAGVSLNVCKTTSSSNPLPGQDTANSVMLMLGGPMHNQVTLYNNAGATRLIADVQGYFVATAPVYTSAVDTVTSAPTGTVTLNPSPLPGGVRPSGGSTGVPVGTVLKAYHGDLVITTPGTVIDSLDVFGFVTIKAADVTIRNSRVRGSGPGSTNTGLINCTSAAVKNAVIEDVTLAPDYPSVWLDGVLGHDFTATRVNTYDVVDGFGVFNTTGPAANVTITSSWVHDLSYFSSDPNHPDNRTHNDAIQIQGGSNIQVVGNELDAYLSTSVGTQDYPYPQAGFGVIVTPNVGPVTGARIDKNWITGSYIPIKLTTGTWGATTFGEVNDNRFAHDMRNVPMDGVNQWFTILMTPDMTATTTGNVYDDTNTPVTVRHDSGTTTAP
jgi:hypothetical protein